MNSSARLRRLALLVLMLASIASQAQTLSLIDTPAGPASFAPRLAPIEGNRAVLSWLETTDQGHRFMLSEFDGQRFGPARQLAEGDRFFANWADTPGIRIGKGDQWLAHWLVRSGRGSYAYDVVMALSSDAGRSWSRPFSPHDDGTLTEHGFVSTFVEPGAEAGFGAVWLDGRNTEPAAEDRHHDHGDHHEHGSGAMTLRSASILPDGRITRAALLDGRVCDCCPTDAAIAEDGVVVVYRDRSEEEVRDIQLVRRGGSGWSDPVVVHADGWRIEACPVNGPAVLARGDRVVVAWFTMAQNLARVQIAWSNDGGQSFGAPVSLDEGTALGRVDLGWSGQDIVLSWLAENESAAELRVARFDNAGTLLARSALRTVNQGRVSGVPRLLGLADGRALLSWTETEGEPARPRGPGRLGSLIRQRYPLWIIDHLVEAASHPVRLGLLDALLVRVDEVPPEVPRPVEGITAEQRDPRAGLRADGEVSPVLEHQQLACRIRLPVHIDRAIGDVEPALFVGAVDRQARTRLELDVDVEGFALDRHLGRMTVGRSGQNARAYPAVLDDRQLVGRMVREVRVDFLERPGQGDPGLQAEQLAGLRPGLVRAALGVDDTAASGHQVDRAGPYDLLRVQAVAVHDLAAEQVGDRGQADVGVRAHVQALPGLEMTQTHLIEEHEGPDGSSLPGWQYAAHLEAADVARARHDDLRHGGSTVLGRMDFSVRTFEETHGGLHGRIRSRWQS